MKKISCLAGLALLCVALVLCSRFFVGCEAANGINGVTVTVNPSVVIYDIAPSPANPNEWPIGQQVQFTASWDSTNQVPGFSYQLALPLTWSVSDPSQGSIAGNSGDYYHGGVTALYVPTGNPGQNIITVRDQYGNEGFAMVTQMSAGSTTSTNSP